MMLNPDVGEIQNDGKRDFILTRMGASGHALYGPYVDLSPGRYAVTFSVRLDKADGDQNAVCAVLDVSADTGRRDVAFDRIIVADLAASSSFTLEFDVAEPLSSCEFRLWATGVAVLRISDAPDLTRRENIGPAFSRLATAMQATRIVTPELMKGVWQSAINVDLREKEVVIPLRHLENFTERLLVTERDRRRLAEVVVGSVGYRGCGENSLFRAFVGTDRPLGKVPQPIPFTSALCQQAHFGYDQYRFWSHALKEEPKYQRKYWEFFFIAQTLFERGFLKPGRQGIVFGAGEEQLPALFASFGVKVLATDQAIDEAVRTGWASSGQYAHDLTPLNQRGICTNRMFSELVSFMPVDMNDIPADLNERFDFCWSACALEHLGSIQHGLDFIIHSLRTLRPGGVAVHTTEFNMSSNDDTLETEGLSLYRRRDIEALFAALETRGYKPSPIDWSTGEGFAEMVVDVAPYLARGEPHIRLKIGQYDCTSIGLIIEKPPLGEDAP